jgi:ADP-ribose pyrophosphatase
MNHTETTLSKQTLLEGIVFDVERHEVQLADGHRSQRDILRHAGGVGVLARRPDGHFLLVRQYRKAMEQEVLEIVAGMREPAEDPEVTARRELEEETGHRVTALTFLGTFYPSPGYTDEIDHLYFADVTAQPEGLRLDTDERLTVESYSRTDLETMLVENQLHDGKTLAAWYWAGVKGCL